MSGILKSVLILVASVALIGCEEDPLSVGEILGVYELETVDGQTLPYSTVVVQPAILGGMFEFRPHNQFFWETRRAPSAPGGTETVTSTDGAYDVVLQRVVLVVGPSQVELDATVSDGVLAFKFNGLNYRFRRTP